MGGARAAGVVNKGSDMLSEIRDALSELRRECGLSVTYKRGSDAVSVTAKIGRTTATQTTGDETVTQVRSTVRDYLIAVSDLMLNGVAVTPIAGDRIEHGGLIFEAMPLGGEGVYSFVDGSRSEFRIHTRARNGN